MNAPPDDHGRPASLAQRSLIRFALLGLASFLATQAPVCLATSPTPKQKAVATPTLQPDWLKPQPSPPDAALSAEGERKADAMASFALGLILEQNADQKRMIEAFQLAVDLDPGNSVLAERLAYEYLRLNDVPSAIGVLKDAIAANPTEPQLLLQLASLYSQSLGKHDKALEYARKALKLAPADPRVFETLLMVNLAAGDRDSGRRTIRQTLAIKNAEPEFWIGCAQVAARLLISDLDPRKAPAEDVDLVTKLFERALASASDNLDILLAVADFRQRFGFPAEAAELLERILTSKDAELPLRVAARDRLARALLAQGDRKGAIAQLEKLVEEAPLQRDAYDFLGQLFEEDGQLERALASYQQVLLLQPVQPLPYLRAAELFVQLGQPDNAITVLQDARRAFPQLPQLTYSLAIAYSHAGRHDLALSTFDLAIQEGRTYDEDIATPTFYFNYGIAAHKAGRMELAMQNFKRAAEMDPANAAPVLNYLGYMLVIEGGDLNEAEKAIRKALELDPKNGAYLDSLGWLEFKRGNYQKALDLLLQAEQLIDPADPSNYEIYDHIGDAYQQLGQHEKALEYWQRASASAPDPEPIHKKIEEATRSDKAADPHETAAESPPQPPTSTSP